MKESTKTHRMMFRLEPEQYARLETAAAAHVRTPAAMVRYIIASWLAENHPQVTTTPAEMAQAGRRQAKRASATTEK